MKNLGNLEAWVERNVATRADPAHGAVGNRNGVIALAQKVVGTRLAASTRAANYKNLFILWNQVKFVRQLAKWNVVHARHVAIGKFVIFAHVKHPGAGF